MKTRRAAAWQVTVAAICATGCRPDLARWQAELSSPATTRMSGSWVLDMTSGERTVSGTIALLVNRVEQPTFWHPSPSPLVGTAELAINTLNLSGGDRASTVAARAVKDSVEITLDVSSGDDLQLFGRWTAGMVQGSWVVSSRSGPSHSGRFTMRRGSP